MPWSPVALSVDAVELVPSEGAELVSVVVDVPDCDEVELVAEVWAALVPSLVVGVLDD